ncbi:MAG: hypothetical protein ACLGIF_05625 [Actinomycetes bacterium]
MVDQAPLLMLVDWADADTVAGIEPDGTVAISDDAGASWTRRGHAGGAPQALGAALPHRVAGSQGLDLLVVTDATLVRSSDGGHTFAPLTR